MVTGAAIFAVPIGRVVPEAAVLAAIQAPEVAANIPKKDRLTTDFGAA
jgi:hypothetical protein